MTSFRSPPVSDPSALVPNTSGGEAKVFGLVILEQRKVIEKLAGHDAIDAALDRLPLDRREEYVSLGLFSWCRAGTAARVLEEVASELGRSPEALTREVVRDGFGRVMRTVWRLFTRFSSDQAIVQRAASLYTKAVDRGAVRARVEREGHIVVDITGWPDIGPIDLVALSTGIETAVGATGRKVQVAARRTREGAHFDVLDARLHPAVSLG